MFTAVFVVGEIYIRKFISVDPRGWYQLVNDPILFYELTPGIAADEAGGRRAHTRQRIRGPSEYAVRPPEGVRRVLWLGDSACFGTDVADHQTGPYLFHLLADADGLAIESINLGVEGYNVRQVREVLARRSTEFQGSDAVVYYHHENDIVNAPWAALAPHTPAGLYWEYEAPQSWARKVAKRSALIRRAWNSDFVVRVIGTPEGQLDPHRLQTVLSDRSYPVPIHPFTRTCASLYHDASSYGQRFRAELYTMADLARANGAAFILVYFPSRTLLHRAELDRLRSVLSGWCAERSIAFVDVTSEFLSSPAPDLYVDTLHPGPAGQQIIAETVLKLWKTRLTQNE